MNFRKILYLFMFVPFLFTSLPKISKAITITDTISATYDNTLYEDAFGSYSNSLGKYFFSGKTATGLLRRGLVLFRVEYRIPSDAVITSVKMRLHMSKTIAGTKRINIYRFSKNWIESISEASMEEGFGTTSEIGDVTWIHNYYDNVLWTSPGGDFNSVSSANTNIGGNGFYEWSSPAMIDDVTFWINNSYYNGGWILTGDEINSASTKRFDSKDNPDPSVRPQLIVTYSTNSIGLTFTALTEGLWHGTDGGYIVSDTMRVYLRSASSPYSLVDSVKVYHNFLSSVVFPHATNPYYVVLNQRNSIETWSKTPVNFVTGYTTPYFFTTDTSQAYGNNQVLEAGYSCMYSGDLNKSGNVNLTDIVEDFNDGTFFATGYLRTDVNGDNIVNLTDLLIVFNNSQKFVSVKKP